VSDLFWQAIAWLIQKRPIKKWLFELAAKRPYTHIKSPDGKEVYMYRHWLFNPYLASGEAKRLGLGWLPSIRLHRIMRADQDRHFHDHPWNARTIILHGWYDEQKPTLLGLRRNGSKVYFPHHSTTIRAQRGDTHRLLYEQYHKITAVSPSGVITLFITWKYRGDWGFLVDGEKVLWREYLANEKTL
jgi:hypothetical protein